MRKIRFLRPLPLVLIGDKSITGKPSGASRKSVFGDTPSR